MDAPEREHADQIQPVDDNLVIYDSAGRATDAIKNLWRGCAGFIVGGGPSLKTLPYHKLADRGVCSLGINNVAAFVPVKAFVFNDPPEKFHTNIWRDPGILKLCPKPKLVCQKRAKTREKLPDGSFRYCEKRTPDYPNVWGYERRDDLTPPDFFTDRAASIGNAARGVAKTGREKIICTMFAALRLVHYMGLRRVYLLGADWYMEPTRAASKQGNYAFNEDRDAGAVEACNALFHVGNKYFCELKPIFDRAGFHVFNCCERSRLRAFPYVSFEDALEDCRNGIEDKPADLKSWYCKGERGPDKPALAAT
jgi:hypothetical protein